MAALTVVFFSIFNKQDDKWSENLLYVHFICNFLYSVSIDRAYGASSVRMPFNRWLSVLTTAPVGHFYVSEVLDFWSLGFTSRDSGWFIRDEGAWVCGCVGG